MHRPGVCEYLAAAAISFGLLIGSTTIADAQESRRVGVVVAVTVNVDEAESLVLAEALGKALSGALMVDVVAGEETKRRLPPEGLSDTCVAEAECLKDVGQRLETDELLMIVITKMGDEVQVDVTWADVSSGKTASRPQITIRGPDADFERYFAAVVTTLLPGATPRVEKVAPPPPVVDPNPTPDPVLPPPVTRPAEGRHMTGVTWTTAAVSVAFLGAGIATGISAASSINTCEDAITPCDKAKKDSIDNKALLADVFYGVAVAGAVTTAILWWTSGSEAEMAPVSVGPMTDSGVGITYGGRF